MMTLRKADYRRVSVLILHIFILSCSFQVLLGPYLHMSWILLCLLSPFRSLPLADSICSKDDNLEGTLRNVMNNDFAVSHTRFEFHLRHSLAVWDWAVISDHVYFCSVVDCVACLLALPACLAVPSPFLWFGFGSSSGALLTWSVGS